MARAIPSQSTDTESLFTEFNLNFSDGNRWEAYWNFCKLVITTCGT